jgi:SHS2 domain-containing protein
VLEHTADTGIIVSAPSLEELFARAAWGMFTVLTDVGTVRPEQEWTVSVTAADPASLLVRWLSELNYLHVTRHDLYCEFAVTRLDDRSLTATVRGEPIDLTRHLVHTEIKAVTYHALRLERSGDLWRAEVLFDL